MICACGRVESVRVSIGGEELMLCGVCVMRVRSAIKNTPKLMSTFDTVMSRYVLKDGNLHRKKTGEPVIGCRNGGYLMVSVNHRGIKVSHVVWMLSHGKPVPRGLVIDHKDGDVDNNHESNLRLYTTRQNNQNRPRHRAGALCGAYMCNGRWQAEIAIMGKGVYLGGFSSEENAHKAYMTACENIDLYDGNNKKFSKLVRNKIGIDLRPNRNIQRRNGAYVVAFMVKGKRYSFGGGHDLNTAKTVRDRAEEALIGGMDGFLSLLQQVRTKRF